MLCFAAALFSRRLLELWLSRLAQKRNRTSQPFAFSTFNFGAIYAHLRSLSFTSTLGLAACQILILPCDKVTLWHALSSFRKKIISITCCRCILGIFLTMEGLGDFHCTSWNWFIDQLLRNTWLRYSFDTELEDGSYVSGGKFFKLAPYQPCALSSASILALDLFAVETVWR